MSVSRRRGRPGLIGTAARTAVIAGTAQATMGAVAGRQQQAAAQQAAAQQAAAQQAAAQQAAAQQAAAELAAQQAAGAQQAAAQPSGGPADDLIAQLQQLAQLHAAGVLSPEEFAQAKAKLLS